MVDYGPGDEIVYVVADCNGNYYKQHTTYICLSLEPGDSPTLRCQQCNKTGSDLICASTTDAPDAYACSCNFRKKLDFKKLCNVDETIKIKEDA